MVLLNVFMFSNHSHALVVLFEFYLKRKEQVHLLNKIEKLDFSLKQNLKLYIDYSRVGDLYSDGYLELLLLWFRQ